MSPREEAIAVLLLRKWLETWEQGHQGGNIPENMFDELDKLAEQTSRFLKPDETPALPSKGDGS